MLENARKQSASLFVYLLFVFLIVIFVINIGPQGGRGGGCSGAGVNIVDVDGQDVSQTSYHVYYSNPYNRGAGKQRVYIALEQLIRRELLAQEAEKRDLRVDSDLVQNEIKKGNFYLGGMRAQIPGIFDEDGLWKLNQFNNWVRSLNVTRNSYLGEQQRGMLAAMMADFLRDSVQVSRDEALAQYLFENNTVQYDVVAFKPDTYRAAMKLTDADVDRFLAAHGSEVEARYKADERTYKATKPALKLRQIFIAKLEEAPPAAPAPAGDAGSADKPKDKPKDKPGDKPADKPADAKPADAKPAKTDKPADKSAKAGGKPDKPVGMKIEDAKAKLEATRAAIASGKEKFAEAAKQLSTDETMKASGGDLGWRTADNPMLGDKAVSDAVKTLKPGDMTPVIATDRGVYLVTAEAKREGDLSYDQVKHDIAKSLAQDTWSKEAAKRAAISALEKARSGAGFNLEQLYDKEQTSPQGPPGGIDIQQILNDPNMSDEDKQKIIQMLLQQQKHGSIVVESKDRLAAWYGQAGDSSGGAKPAGSAAAGKPAGTTSGTGAAPGTGKPAGTTTATGAAPGTGKPAGTTSGTGAASGTASGPGTASASGPGSGPASGAGSGSGPASGAGSAPATGSGSGPAAGAGPGPAPGSAPGSATAAGAEITASKDQLPAFGDVAKPTVARFGPAPRTSTMAGLGPSKEAAAALFEDLTPGALAKRVYEGDNGYVVVQLISRSQPKVADFEKDADRLVEELRAERGKSFLEAWLKERCEKLVKDNRLQANPGLIRESDDKGNPLPTVYKPCMSFR